MTSVGRLRKQVGEREGFQVENHWGGCPRAEEGHLCRGFPAVRISGALLKGSYCKRRQGATVAVVFRAGGASLGYWLHDWGRGTLGNQDF